MPSKVGHNEERRSYAEIRKYCDYNWTLKLSNSGINGVKNFSPVEFMHKYLGKTGNLRDLDPKSFQSDNAFLADSMIGLRYLLDKWHLNQKFGQLEIDLLNFMSYKPVSTPKVDSETGDWILPSEVFKSMRSDGSETLAFRNDFEDWIRFFLVNNVWDLLLGKWNFKVCETEDCLHYTLSSKRFHDYACGSKHRMRMLRQSKKEQLADNQAIII